MNPRRHALGGTRGWQGGTEAACKAMKLVFTECAWADYLCWRDADRIVLARVNENIKDASRAPFRGLRKPEPLAGNLKDFGSRRITRERRMVYRVSDAQALEIVACRFRYD
jgi:toxin YoeB